MKNFFCFIIVLFTLIGNNVFAVEGTPGVINPNFKLGNLDLQRVSSDLYYVKNTTNNINYLRSVFKNMNILSDDPNYLSVGPYDKQCAAVTQNFTNVGLVVNWIKGINANNRFSVKLFTPVATFYNPDGSSSENYSNYSPYSHTGILVSFDRDGFYMLQQNWGGSGDNPIGKLSIRFFSGKGNYQNNANNYYVINKY